MSDEEVYRGQKFFENISSDLKLVLENERGMWASEGRNLVCMPPPFKEFKDCPVATEE